MTRRSVHFATIMRKTLCTFIMLILSVTAICEEAIADPTFLLQLGTFDSQNDANQKWQEIKAKNADLVGSLNLHVAQVSLPPDNSVTYRVQVGPVSTREQADSLCSSLSGRDVKCYVVETAMFDTEAPVVQQSVNAVPAPSRKAATVALQEDTSHSDDPDYIPPPMDSGPVIVSSSAPAPSVTSPAEVAELPVAPETPAPAMREAPVVAAPEPAPAPVAAAPAPPATAQIAEAVPTPVAPPTPAPSARSAPPSAPVASTTASRYLPGREPHFLDSDTNVASAPPVFTTPEVATSVNPSMVAETVPVPAPEPVSPPKSRGFFARLFSSEPPEPAATEGVVGSVNVAEAVRVPLSNDNQPPKQAIVPVIPAVHGLGGYPDDSTAKTYWAQVSYFRDEPQALTFYHQFTAANPQFTDLRLRITRPFIGSAIAARVSLRVGPFASTNDVGVICATANRWKARCTVVRDIGSSAAVSKSSERANRRMHAVPATSSPAETGDSGAYWAQLGTYHSAADAWEAWNLLKADHKKLFRHVRPTVTTPAMSSARGAVYRLRAGPYDSLDKANDLCNHLASASAGCVVVNER